MRIDKDGSGMFYRGVDEAETVWLVKGMYVSEKREEKDWKCYEESYKMGKIKWNKCGNFRWVRVQNFANPK